MNKKERLSEFNRNSILATAKQLFHEKGVSQTTMDDIAKKAEYSKSTIYVYFKSKDEIYNYIILEHIAILRNCMKEAIYNTPEFPGGYYAICNVLVDFYNTYPLYFESMLDEIKLPQNESESVLIQIYQIGEEINEIIKEYINKNTHEAQFLLELNPLQTTFTLWAGISGIITLANKKEAYINKAMEITKEKFMYDGFELLLKSVTSGKG